MEQKNQEKYMHWAFSSVKKVIEEHGEKDIYTCASGITPSGTIHIGNFREAITVDLVKRAFNIMGYKARHIHSWDDYDVFRKVPKNMPEQEKLKEHLRMSIIDTPDTTGKAENYAEKNKKEVEETLPEVGINLEYRHQAKMYMECKYAEGIKKALENKDKIIDILNKYRKEPLKEGWLPVAIFCDNCKKDTITKIEWKGDYLLYYECSCGHSEEFDFRKKGIVKLLWRVDWPMRWDYEDVIFEPGGKDHSSPGSSYETGKQIVNEVWNKKAPSYIMYDFIRIKGGGGKISSSSGEVVTLADCLEIYEPEIIRYLFAGTRPNTEFAISFDQDVIKIYEDYDKCERIYHGKEETGDKEKQKNKWIYLLSRVDEDKMPDKILLQIPFREITSTLCIKQMDIESSLEHFRGKITNKDDEKRLRKRIECAKNWLEKYADEQFVFKVNESRDEEFIKTIDENQKKALDMLKQAISSESTAEEMEEQIFEIPKELNMPMREFFQLCYMAIIGRKRGPKLAGFIEEIGRDKVKSLL